MGGVSQFHLVYLVINMCNVELNVLCNLGVHALIGALLSGLLRGQHLLPVLAVALLFCRKNVIPCSHGGVVPSVIVASAHWELGCV